MILPWPCSTPAAISDTPTYQDSLGYKVYARALANILARGSQTPLTLGIHGDWGAGKTSLMRMLELEVNPLKIVELLVREPDSLTHLEREYLIGELHNHLLDSTLSTDVVIQRYKDFDQQFREWQRSRFGKQAFDPDAPVKEKYLECKRQLFSLVLHPDQLVVDSLWFNAWEHDDELVVWSALLGTIREHIHDNPRYPASKEIIEELKEIGKSSLGGLVRVALPVLRGVTLEDTGLDKLFEASESMIQYRAKMEKTIRTIVVEAGSLGGYQNALLVFIDDLDRCAPETVINLIERLKVFFDIRGCIFCLAASEEVIASGLEAKGISSGYTAYFKGKGRRYLEKIIQIPFQLPKLSQGNLRKLVSQMNLDAEMETNISRLLPYLTPNPRLLKRFVNTYMLLRELSMIRRSQGEYSVDTRTLAEIHVIQAEWPSFYESLVKFGYQFYNEVYCLCNPTFEFVRSFVTNTSPAGWSDAVTPDVKRSRLLELGKQVYAGEDPLRSSAWECFRDYAIWQFMRNTGRRNPDELERCLSLATSSTM